MSEHIGPGKSSERVVLESLNDIQLANACALHQQARRGVRGRKSDAAECSRSARKSRGRDMKSDPARQESEIVSDGMGRADGNCPATSEPFLLFSEITIPDLSRPEGILLEKQLLQFGVSSIETLSGLTDWEKTITRCCLDAPIPRSMIKWLKTLLFDLIYENLLDRYTSGKCVLGLDVEEWGSEDVCWWMSSEGPAYHEYAKIMWQKEVTGFELLAFNAMKLTELKIHRYSQAHVLSKIQELDDEITGRFCFMPSKLTLDRSGFEFKQKLNISAIASFCRAMKSNTVVQSLTLSKQEMNNAEAQLLSSMLKLNTGIVSLAILESSFNDKAWDNICDALVVNDSIKKLDLKDNNLGDVKTQQLAKVLIENNVLECVNLAFNDIGDISAKALAEGLQDQHTIAWLNLRGNLIGDEGLLALGNAKRVKGLGGIDLSLVVDGNRFTPKALKEFKKILKRGVQLNRGEEMNILDEAFGIADGKKLKEKQSSRRLLSERRNSERELGGGDSMASGFNPVTALSLMSLKKDPEMGETNGGTSFIARMSERARDLAISPRTPRASDGLEPITPRRLLKSWSAQPNPICVH